MEDNQMFEHLCLFKKLHSKDLRLSNNRQCLEKPFVSPNKGRAFICTNKSKNFI